MRIALCFSGQPRTWKKTHQHLIDLFKPHGDVDVFFHFWDYNTLPRLLESHGVKIEDELLPLTELTDLVETLAPKNYKIESRKEIKYWNCAIPQEKQFGPWCIEQFYSLYYVSILKREYELKHDFRYDVVVRLRTDIWFPDGLQLTPVEHNTLHTAHCAWDKEYDVYRVGDIFYYADSHTFDQVAEFFKFLSFVPTEWVTKVSTPPPEIAFYFYLANIGILNKPTHPVVKVLRDQRVMDIKGKLAGYEII